MDDAVHAALGQTVMPIGRHTGSTFSDLFKNEKGYVKWVVKEKPTRGALAELHTYIIHEQGSFQPEPAAAPATAPPAVIYSRAESKRPKQDPQQVDVLSQMLAPHPIDLGSLGDQDKGDLPQFARLLVKAGYDSARCYGGEAKNEFHQAIDQRVMEGVGLAPSDPYHAKLELLFSGLDAFVVAQQAAVAHARHLVSATRSADPASRKRARVEEDDKTNGPSGSVPDSDAESASDDEDNE